MTKNKGKIAVIFALMVLIASVGCLAGYFLKAHHEDVQIRNMASHMSLLDLYEQNHDLAGWIRVPGTSIDYPVMDSNAYLHQNFSKEYEYRGTPFVMNDWGPESRNSMIYGHNMWVEKTVFNTLHKYEKEKFYNKHKTAEFFVILGKDTDSPYVEKRTYAISYVCPTSIKSDLYLMASDLSAETEEAVPDEETDLLEEMLGDVPEEEADTGPSLIKLYGYAKEASLYREEASAEDADALTLCTCSYHISGDRDSGRILIIGREEKREKKDMFD